jgi:eukaryotic-like serine/threonine-protein kinase
MSELKRLIREVHRRSLWQVLTIYLVGSWMGYQVVVALTQGIGLPAWVPGFAIVLFIIGLPIVLATAFVQEGLPPTPGRRGRASRPARRSPAASAESGGYTAPSGPAGPAGPAGSAGSTARGARAVRASSAARAARAGRVAPAAASAAELRGAGPEHWLLTWRRAVLGGVVAFLLLGVTAGGYMGLRNAGVGPFGSLIAAGALAERERVLIADFSASPGDEELARALTQAFRVDLTESPVLHVLEASHAREVLERMEHDPTAPLTQELARQVAVRDGIKAFLTGDVLRAGHGYSLSASLVTASDGTVLASFRETAADTAAVLDAIGRLSRRMRERVGESLRTVNAGRKLESVTTPSLEALRKYSDAVHAADIEQDNRLAVALLREALAHDSAFGMAWRKLAVTYSNMQIGREPVLEAVTQAYAHRDRMTARERDHTVAFYHMHVTRDYPASIAAYRAVLAAHPEDHAAHNNLAIVYGYERRYEQAIEHQQRAVELLPHRPAGHTNLAFRLHQVNRLDEADAVLAGFRERFGESRASVVEALHLAYSRHDLDAALALTARLRELDPQDARARADAAHTFADLAALRGRLADEERHRAMAVAAEIERGDAALPLVARIWFAQRELDVLRDADAALRRLDAALAEYPLAALPPADRPYGDLVRAYGRAGRPDRARELLQEYERVIPAEQRGDERAWRASSAADIALGSGDYGEALRQLRALEPLSSCERCVAQRIGLVFDLLGQPDSAIAHYERFVALPYQRRLWQDAYLLAPTHERLAALHELHGERERAMLHAARFTELWQDADAVLRPRVAAKHALLTRLRERR